MANVLLTAREALHDEQVLDAERRDPQVRADEHVLQARGVVDGQDVGEGLVVRVNPVGGQAERLRHRADVLGDPIEAAAHRVRVHVRGPHRQAVGEHHGGAAADHERERGAQPGIESPEGRLEQLAGEGRAVRGHSATILPWLKGVAY